MKTSKIVVSFQVVSMLMGGCMGFTMGYYSEFLRAAHLDELMINLVNLSFFITITIFEIPTGLFADIFGRKGSLIISLILSGISLLIYGLSACFIGFVLAEIIIGIASTFASGAFEAWLTDSLSNAGVMCDQVKIRRVNTRLRTAAMITTCLLGGIASQHGLNKPFFCGSILYFITAILACFIIKETYFNRRRISFKQYLIGSRKIWKKSVLFARTDRNFSFILISSNLLMFAVMTTNMQWPRICKNLGYNDSDNGIIAGIILFVLAIGSEFAGRIKCLAENRKLEIIMGQLFVGIGITLALLFDSKYLVLSLFMLHELGRGALKTLKGAYIQECITTGEERATLGSFVSMVEHLGGALGLLVSGLLAKNAGYTVSWVISGLILIIFSLILLRQCKGKSN